MAYTHADVVDFGAGVAADPNVAAASALRHNRLHSITSAQDHLDVFSSGPIADGDVLLYQASIGKWVPTQPPNPGPPTPGQSGLYADTFALMGG